MKYLLVAALLTSTQATAGTFNRCLSSELNGTFHGTYETTPLKSGQDKKDIERSVYILPEEERAMAKLEIKDGLVYDSFGKLANYRSQRMYVMDAEGSLYELTSSRLVRLNHSSVFEGDPIAGAGMIRLKNGRVTYISSSSGHYKPSPEIFKQTLEELYRKNVDLSLTQIGLGGDKENGPVLRADAEKLLFNDEKSIACIGKSLREHPERATADGFRLHAKLDPAGTRKLIQDIERDGRFDSCASELAQFLKTHPQYISVISAENQVKVKELRKRCSGSVLQALRSLLGSH